MHRCCACSSSIPFKGFGGGQCGPGHHWMLAKRSAAGLLLPCMCTQHLDAVGSLSAKGYKPILIPWSWIPVSSGCWSSALFGSSSWHLHYMLSPPGKKKVGWFASTGLKQVSHDGQHRKAWLWQGKCPAVTGIDQAKLFYQHCICMKKKRGEKTPKPNPQQKEPNPKNLKHPEDITDVSWLSEDMSDSCIQLLNQTVSSNTPSCTAKGTAHFPDLDTPCISSSLSPTLEMRYKHSITFKMRMKPKIFISKMQMLWFCQARPDAKAMKCPRERGGHHTEPSYVLSTNF